MKSEILYLLYNGLKTKEEPWIHISCFKSLQKTFIIIIFLLFIEDIKNKVFPLYMKFSILDFENFHIAKYTFKELDMEPCYYLWGEYGY